MGYRDELGAAQTRADALERQLAEARDEIERLKAPPPEPPKPKPKPPRPRKPRRNHSLGGVYFNPPRTYVPMLHLWKAGVIGAWHRCPRFRPAETNNLLSWLLQRLVLWPLVNLVYAPVFLALLVLVLAPVSAAVSVFITMAGLPVVIASRFRVGDPARDPRGAGWPRGDYDESAGRLFLWILMSCFMQPLLLVFMPILSDD